MTFSSPMDHVWFNLLPSAITEWDEFLPLFPFSLFCFQTREKVKLQSVTSIFCLLSLFFSRLSGWEVSKERSTERCVPSWQNGVNWFTFSVWYNLLLLCGDQSFWYIELQNPFQRNCKWRVKQRGGKSWQHYFESFERYSFQFLICITDKYMKSQKE